MTALDVFVADKEESSVKIAKPVPLKTRDPFLRIIKKIGPMVSLKAQNGQH